MKRIEAAASFGAFSSRRGKGTLVRSGVPPSAFGHRRLRFAAPRSIVSRAPAAQPNREEGSRRAETRPFLERRSRSTGGSRMQSPGGQVVRDESSRTIETDTLVRSKKVKRARPHVLREHPSITFPRNAFRYKRRESKSALEDWKRASRPTPMSEKSRTTFRIGRSKSQIPTRVFPTPIRAYFVSGPES